MLQSAAPIPRRHDKKGASGGVVHGWHVHCMKGRINATASNGRFDTDESRETSVSIHFALPHIFQALCRALPRDQCSGGAAPEDAPTSDADSASAGVSPHRTGSRYGMATAINVLYQSGVIWLSAEPSADGE
jgi:hypothetical protein